MCSCSIRYGPEPLRVAAVIVRLYAVYGSRLLRTNEVLGVCVVLEPPVPNRVRVYSVISPLASRGRCQTIAMEEDDRFLVDTSNGAELGTER